MRIAITGVSGFVGSQIIPRLRERGVDLVLLGRDPNRLCKSYPAETVFGYDQMHDAFAGVDAVLHLAVKNNISNVPIAAYRVVNVKFLKEIVAAVREAGVPRLIYTSSTHAGARSTPYGITKHEAEIVLQSGEEDLILTILRLPAIYGERFSGRLGRLLGWVPQSLRGPAFKTLAAIKPTIHIDNVARAVIKATHATERCEIFVSDRQLGNCVYHSIKRAIDLLFCVAVLLLLWWLFIIVWILVRVTSPGPGIYAQERVGQHGKLFTIYKFRTMRKGTEIAASHDTSVANITAIGGFLRKHKIDELPQVINILRNEMSLVGPRPCLPIQTEVLKARRDFGVLDVKGGITGYAQIKDIDMSNPRRLAKADAYYHVARTVPFDIMIILRTAIGAGRGDRVDQMNESN